MTQTFLVVKHVSVSFPVVASASAISHHKTQGNNTEQSKPINVTEPLHEFKMHDSHDYFTRKILKNMLHFFFAQVMNL